jgi:hypothetical protein
MSELKQERCPLCGGPNECGLAAGKSECWCFEAKIAPEVLERVPKEAKGKVCVCAKCAGGSATDRRIRE